MALKLRDRTIECLKAEPNKKFTVRQIAEWVFKTYPEECEAKRMKSTARIIPLDDDNSFITQLVAEIGSNRPALQKKHPELKTTEGRPRMYYWSIQSDEDELIRVESESTQIESEGKEKSKYTEHDLYPILSKYLKSELGVYGKRIDENKSSNLR